VAANGIAQGGIININGLQSVSVYNALNTSSAGNGGDINVSIRSGNLYLHGDGGVPLIDARGGDGSGGSLAISILHSTPDFGGVNGHSGLVAIVGPAGFNYGTITTAS